MLIPIKVTVEKTIVQTQILVVSDREDIDAQIDEKLDKLESNLEKIKLTPEDIAEWEAI